MMMDVKQILLFAMDETTAYQEVDTEYSLTKTPFGNSFYGIFMEETNSPFRSSHKKVDGEIVEKRSMIGLYCKNLSHFYWMVRANDSNQMLMDEAMDLIKRAGFEISCGFFTPEIVDIAETFFEPVLSQILAVKNRQIFHICENRLYFKGESDRFQIAYRSRQIELLNQILSKNRTLLELAPQIIKSFLLLHQAQTLIPFEDCLASIFSDQDEKNVHTEYAQNVQEMLSEQTPISEVKIMKNRMVFHVISELLSFQQTVEIFQALADDEHAEKSMNLYTQISQRLPANAKKITVTYIDDSGNQQTVANMEFHFIRKFIFTLSSGNTFFPGLFLQKADNIKCFNYFTGFYFLPWNKIISIKHGKKSIYHA